MASPALGAAAHIPATGRPAGSWAGPGRHASGMPACWSRDRAGSNRVQDRQHPATVSACGRWVRAMKRGPWSHPGPSPAAAHQPIHGAPGCGGQRSSCCISRLGMQPGWPSRGRDQRNTPMRGRHVSGVGAVDGLARCLGRGCAWPGAMPVACVMPVPSRACRRTKPALCEAAGPFHAPVCVQRARGRKRKTRHGGRVFVNA